jgi:hypothetical protein
MASETLCEKSMRPRGPASKSCIFQVQLFLQSNPGINLCSKLVKAFTQRIYKESKFRNKEVHPRIQPNPKSPKFIDPEISSFQNSRKRLVRRQHEPEHPGLQESLCQHEQDGSRQRIHCW